MATPKKKLSSKSMKTVKAARSITLTKVEAKKNRTGVKGIFTNSQPKGL